MSAPGYRDLGTMKREFDDDLRHSQLPLMYEDMLLADVLAQVVEMAKERQGVLNAEEEKGYI